MRLTQWLRKADGVLMDILYPRKLLCLACGERTEGGWLCPSCRILLEADRIRGDLCPVCGHPMVSGMDCAFCAEGPVPARAAFVHRGVPRHLVHQLKFSRVRDAAKPLAEEMGKVAGDWQLSPDAVVTWVTTTPKHIRERGYDQARLLAEGTAHELGLPCRRLLTRQGTRRLHQQLGLGREARMQNLQGTFRCDDKLTGDVILVDDVMTTGSTARVSMAALKAAGADRVFVLTATQARRIGPGEAG